MASRVYELTITVPSGTNASNPQVTPWVTEDNVLDSIEVEIPPGHNGLTGIRVMKGDVQILPWSGNTWIVASDYDRVYQVGAFTPTRDVTVQTYNNGTYNHTFFLRMTMSDYVPPGSGSAVTEASAIPLDTGASSPDPLSPDAILGASTAAALANGTVTADEIAPVDNSALIPADTGSVTG